MNRFEIAGLLEEAIAGRDVVVVSRGHYLDSCFQRFIWECIARDLVYESRHPSPSQIKLACGGQIRFVTERDIERTQTDIMYVDREIVPLEPGARWKLYTLAEVCARGTRGEVIFP